MEPLDERVAGIALLDQPLRRALYDLLTASGEWVGRDEAADALGTPRSVAAFHLDKLADAGLAEVRYERPAGRGGPGAGRPAKQYRRSGKEVSVTLPPRHYELAARVLADGVAQATETGADLATALRDAARKAGEEAGAALPAPNRRSRSAVRRAATAALERLGYEPRDGGGDIVLANCPFHALAERHRALVCGLNLDLLTGLAATIDDTLTPRLDPADGYCCVRVSTG